MSGTRLNEFMTALRQLARRVLPVRRDAQRGRDAHESETVSLLAELGHLLTWHDRHGDVVRAAGTIGGLGVSADAFRGAGLFNQVHIPDRPTYLKALSDAANGAGPVSAEFRLHATLQGDTASDAAAYRRRDLTWVEMRAHPVRPPRGGEAVLCFIRDATTFRRHAEELESARLEAVQANELKGKFLATVSHELRTPLNAIIGFSELLAADHPYVMTEERRTEYATIIRDSGHHLLEVVNTLLDMSKIESGNFHFLPEPFDFAALMTSVCDLMQLKAQAAGLTLAQDLVLDLPEVVADRRACRQILINLVSNALKFTPKGGTVTLSLRREGDRMVLAVSDDGIGIGENDLPKLGVPFFQAGDVHCRPHEGTGLGLSVVRGLVGLHRGSMAIESGPGCGTSVSVTLPIRCEEAPEGGRPAAMQVAVRRPTPYLTRRSA